MIIEMFGEHKSDDDYFIIDNNKKILSKAFGEHRSDEDRIDLLSFAFKEDKFSRIKLRQRSPPAS